MRMDIRIYSGWISPCVLYSRFVALSTSAQICTFAFCFQLCLLCRRFLCGLLSVVALAAEQGPYGVQTSVATACGVFLDQGSNPSPELAGRLLTTEVLLFLLLWWWWF